MTKYIYGASVQGIQRFIFQTNRLKDIVGASEIVERACTSIFEEVASKQGQKIVSAAGNVKCIFDSKESCEQVVLRYPKRVMEVAPGITISQAVVAMDDDMTFQEANERLECRLHAQRNRPMKSLTQGYMAIERSRRTGLPAVTKSEEEFIDEGSRAKRNAQTGSLREKFFGTNAAQSMQICEKDLTGKNDWIAIIHADGNGLGDIVAQKVGTEELSVFSTNLNTATIEAARAAYQMVCPQDISAEPLARPVVLGGDDLTLICRADIAVPFVKNYLQFFEERTECHLRKKLTACAGISFVKSSYPFYYAYNLAETLCSYAKKDAKSEEMKRQNKGEVASCMMFHKVQSSFIEDFSVIKEKELMPHCSNRDAQDVSLCFGPYYLKEQRSIEESCSRWSIDELTNAVKELTDNDDGNIMKSRIREWLTLLSEGQGAASQLVERVHSYYTQHTLFDKLVHCSRRGHLACSPAYDVLALHTINNQITK